MIVLELQKFILNVKAIRRCQNNSLVILKREDHEVNQILIIHLSKPLLLSIQIRGCQPINLEELFLLFSGLRQSHLLSLN